LVSARQLGTITSSFCELLELSTFEPGLRQYLKDQYLFGFGLRVDRYLGSRAALSSLVVVDYQGRKWKLDGLSNVGVEEIRTLFL